MSSSFSFKTPMASFSVTDHAVNQSQDSFHSINQSVAPQPHSIIPISTTTTTTSSHVNIHSDDDEAEHLLGKRYESNRLKQEKLLVFTNIFRIIVICVAAPLIYYYV
ncbi:unnamed protein product [Adineta steineri]|uniref:Transmembrane protein n=1 Tax=Adineta steineri TaxID=433720 RepID=A0A814SU08_9BILA|nr:unnamed protein product [Adineta steineri]CAF3535265.1 unnamed protein product [Adineta steineri]